VTAGPELRRDPVLARVWVELRGDGVGLLGIGAGSDGQTGCVLVVTAEPVDPDDAGAAAGRTVAGRMAAELGLDQVRVITAQGPGLRTVLRDWLYQAAQGSGRGVRIEPAEPEPGVLELRVSSWDSSAREVELRLAGLGAAAAPEAQALAAVLGIREVRVREVDG
jgi:hypothetical protein